MMNNRHVIGQLTRSRILLVLASLALLCAGCTTSAKTLQLTSYKDAYFPQDFDLHLDECVFYRDAGGDLHICGRSQRPVLLSAETDADSPYRHAGDVQPVDEPAGDARAQKAEADFVEQLLHIHIFWRPRPGKTHANPTTTDAIMRYGIVTGTGAALYTGTGFAYPKLKSRGKRLAVDVESARLALANDIGDAPTLLGPTRVQGRIVARERSATVIDIRRELDLLETR